MTYSATVAGNVRAELARAGWSQTRVAGLLNVTQSAVSDRQRTRTPWQLDELAALADALGIPVERFVVTPGGLVPTDRYGATAGHEIGITTGTRVSVGVRVERFLGVEHWTAPATGAEHTSCRTTWTDGITGYALHPWENVEVLDDDESACACGAIIRQDDDGRWCDAGGYLPASCWRNGRHIPVPEPAPLAA